MIFITTDGGSFFTTQVHDIPNKFKNYHSLRSFGRATRAPVLKALGISKAHAEIWLTNESFFSA